MADSDFPFQIVQTGLPDLMKSYVETYTQEDPLWKHFLDAGAVKYDLKNYQYEWTLNNSGPGQVSNTRKKGARIKAGDRSETAKAEAFCGRLVYAWSLGADELQIANSSKADLAQLYKGKPKEAVKDFRIRLTKSMMNGTETGDEQDYFTFNGTQTYNPTGSTDLQGFFEAADRDSQTNTVFGVARRGAAGGFAGHYHQYDHINDMTDDGEHVLQSVRDDVAIEGLSEEDHLNLMMADRISYKNYLRNHKNKVQLFNRGEVKGGMLYQAARAGILVGDGCPMYQSPYIDVTAWGATAGAEGVIYGFNINTWKIMFQGTKAEIETNGQFALRGPTRIDQKEEWYWEIIAASGLCCEDSRKQALITGGMNGF